MTTDEDIAILAENLKRDAMHLTTLANLLEERGARVRIATVQTRSAVGLPHSEPFKWTVEVSVTPPTQPLNPPAKKTGLQDALEAAESQAAMQSIVEDVDGVTEAHGRFEVRQAGTEPIRCADCGATWKDDAMGREALWSHACQ